MKTPWVREIIWLVIAAIVHYLVILGTLTFFYFMIDDWPMNAGGSPDIPGEPEIVREGLMNTPPALMSVLIVYLILSFFRQIKFRFKDRVLNWFVVGCALLTFAIWAIS